jgi:hypothetical protein
MLKVSKDLVGPVRGKGAYAVVYEYGVDMALKVADNDGTRDFIEWCFVRGRRYGRGSPEMKNLPWVFAVGDASELPVMKEAQGCYSRDSWYAVMERYDYTIRVHKGWSRTHWSWELCQLPELADTVHLLHGHLGDEATGDLHSGNVMWSEARQELIITDPSGNSYTGSCADTVRALTAPRWAGFPSASLRRALPATRAQWKLPPLQQQFHMRVQ